MRRTFVLIVAIGLLGAYDLAAATTVRCSRVDDRRRVVTLSDLDVLWSRTPFVAAADGARGRFSALRLSAARNVTLTIETTDRDRHCSPAGVFALLNGSATERALATTENSGGGALVRYAMTIPAADLRPGVNAISFRVVACDLSGYYAIPGAFSIDVAGESARRTNA